LQSVDVDAAEEGYSVDGQEAGRGAVDVEPSGGGGGDSLPSALPTPSVEVHSGLSRCSPFPVSECANVERVAECESSSGRHPDTYRTDLLHGGLLQIAKGTWAGYFWEKYGWTWAEVVTDEAIHLAAAFEIWERAGRVWSGPWPYCSRFTR
jgi:hypothetical protein